ncbi:RNA polymerase sigma factor [Clostridium sp. AL.422]|uniref:RNA polymerase sigma factor n=1 Tax=Clostridium TaxID=1485 RepID=UPI00293DF702|nr:MULTISPECIES: RNA polymerase sigma factor [unclassified Clostridium]MDV4149274.1 RNA polymerase sigma factor [Clostridium sp. AL.422]
MELMIKKAQKGDKEAFIKLINEYTLDMYKVAKSKLNSEEDIGDAIQETILSAYKNICILKEVRYFKTWIIKILINKCNDIINKNKKIVYVEEYYDDSNNSLAVDNITIEENIIFLETLSILNEEYRIVVILYYVEGFNTREISKILKEKEGTIKSRLSRARKQLKEYYLKYDNEESSINFNLGGNIS